MTVNIFVSKISVINHVTKIKRRNNFKKKQSKKKKKKKIALPCIIKLFIILQELRFHILRLNLNKTAS